MEKPNLRNCCLLLFKADYVYYIDIEVKLEPSDVETNDDEGKFYLY